MDLNKFIRVQKCVNYSVLMFFNLLVSARAVNKYSTSWQINRFPACVLGNSGHYGAAHIYPSIIVLFKI